MKVCLVNVKNCINYSQYGPFFFEHIKKGDCVVYNDVTSMEDLTGLHDFILSEINRNAFASEKIKLIFFIPRDMICPDVCDYEFFNHISIYVHILSKIKVFSEVAVFYFDSCRGKVEDENHSKCLDVSGRMFADEECFRECLPICGCDLKDRNVLKEKIDGISCEVFREFFTEVFCEIPENMEERYTAQLMNIFTSKCGEKVKKIITNYIRISPQDIADSIKETLGTVYFVKELIENPEKSARDMDNFEIRHEEIREIIATYKDRLGKWYNDVPFSKEYEKIKKKREFIKLNRASTESMLDGIIEKNFDKKGMLLDTDDGKGNSATGKDYVDRIFEILDGIVSEADDRMRSFAQEEVRLFRADSSYNKDVPVNEEENHELKERQLLEKLGENLAEGIDTWTPGLTEQIRLEHWLEEKKKEADELCKCKRNYELKSFLGIFALNFLSVAVLYFIAQYSVFVQDNAFWIYLVYCLVTGAGFFSSFIANMSHYKRGVEDLVEGVQLKVKVYLEDYEKMMKAFEENLNNAADYICQKELVDKIRAVEQQRESDIRKFEWHKQRVGEILYNLRHFDDYIRDTAPVKENIGVAPDGFDDDIEHTEFYQMKIFAR